MKIVLSFDSFKGNLPAREVCEIVRAGILSVRPGAEIVILPMADGGRFCKRFGIVMCGPVV